MRWLSSLFERLEEQLDDGKPALDPVDAVIVEGPLRRVASLPQFRGSATDQLSATTRFHDRVRLQLRKAFTPARPVMDPAMFAGRTDLLHTLIRAIEDQYLHVVLFGPRGIGKTSTLHVLCGIARDSRYIVRYMSCGERTHFDALFRAVLTDVPLLFHDKYDPTANEIEDGMSFADLLDDRALTVDLVSDILTKVAGTRLLIVLDEFDRATDAEFRRSVAELIKNLSDRGSHVQLVIAGVAQNLTEIIEHVPSIRRNILGLLLPNMTQDEIAELIGNGQQASGMTFTPTALRLISLAALGLPYLASLVAQHAGLAALDRESATIDHSDVEKGIEQVVDHLDLRISPDMRRRIQLAIDNGHEDALGRLAQVALANSFRLPAPEIERELGTVSGHSVLHELEQRYRLVLPITADASDAFAFTDDGVPLFLWVRLMHSHVRDNDNS